MKWLEFIIAILSGMATTIPLIIKLVKVVEDSIRERNWDKLLKLVMNLMESAESMFDDGASRKEWVLQYVDAMSDSVDYDIDMEVVSGLIDNLCSMSKQLNTREKAV